MSDHAVTFDHSDCEHDEGDCSPYPTFVCTAPVDADCRTTCQPANPRDYCDWWTRCETCDGYGHPPITGPHCTEGHPLVSGQCNAVEWFMYDDWQAASDEGHPTQVWPDGPIDIEYTGDSYAWSFAVPVTDQEADR
ncbi:hypothetical protein [Nakamurella leprariae]|uniref:Uncharacterized protein n=1 Tax=Nakamurella leprariae TaxID=2803911 RepID=A0A938YCY0_9ACTN|nr:hypothetical protein [Nakamurella leprariae]MBM9467286.1 hypothetical protein [Nakamurella leprariae]